MSVNEQTWGFDFEGVPEADGFENPPVGHYTMEIADTIFKTNKNGEQYLSVVYNILDADNAEWVGKKHFGYVSLDPERLQYTKKDWRRMGVPEAALTNDGGPQMMIGTVFEVDLVENSKGYLNMRYIQPKTIAKPEPAAAQPAPQRASRR